MTSSAGHRPDDDRNREITRGAAAMPLADAVSIRHAAAWRMGTGRHISLLAANRASRKTENRSGCPQNRSEELRRASSPCGATVEGVFH